MTIIDELLDSPQLPRYLERLQAVLADEQARRRRFYAVLSPSTEERDRGLKFADYAAHGVDEYWLIEPQARSVEQYLLEGERYQLQIKARSGEIVARALPGFSIPILAIFDGAANLAALQAILAG